MEIRVQGGRLEEDEPVDLPEYAEIGLVAVNGDHADDGKAELDDEELDRLDKVIDRSDAQIARGETVPFEVVLQDVRRILHDS